jgi:hypothetical protein
MVAEVVRLEEQRELEESRILASPGMFVPQF